MRLRQVALVARDRDAAVADLRAVLGLGEVYHDPGVEVFGLRNAVVPIGSTFLEVVSPLRDGTTAGRLLDRRGGDGGYMVIVQTSDLEADRRRMTRLGVRIVWEIALDDAETMHLHPKDVGGAILSLDAMRPPESWRWAGPDWASRVRTEVVSKIVGVELQGRDPDRMASRWAEVLGRSASPGDGGERRIELEDGTIRFVADSDGRGEGVRGVDLRAGDPSLVFDAAKRRGLATSQDSVSLCGTRFRILG